MPHASRDPGIRTERLVLSRLVAADAPAVFAYRSAPAVSHYQNFAPESAAQVEAFIARAADVAFDTPGAWFQFAIREREGGPAVGDVGVHVRGDDPRQAEIGITLDPAVQGRGYAAEAMAGVIGHLFGPGGKHRVFASVDPRNGPSVRLLERLGLRREAHFRQSLWFRGGWADDVVYAMLAAEWRSDATGGSSARSPAEESR